MPVPDPLRGQGPGPAAPLTELASGARGRVVELRLGPGERHLPSSPLQPGADVYVVEAAGGRWLHVRIGFREYSIPTDLAERVLVATDDAGPPEPAPAAATAYTVLVSRLDRETWRVRGVERGSGTVARSEAFEAEADARARWEALSRDAASLDLAAFRERYRLP